MIKSDNYPNLDNYKKILLFIIISNLLVSKYF